MAENQKISSSLLKDDFAQFKTKGDTKDTVRKKTSFIIDENLYMRFKMRACEDHKSVTVAIEEAMHDWLKE